MINGAFKRSSKAASTRAKTTKQSAVTWQPTPGPQALAFACDADQLGYGGAAGGGKTELALGKAAYGPHKRSIIFRRTFPSVRGIIERSRELFALDKGSYNEQLHIRRLASGRIIEFGSLQYEDDCRKHQGQARDLIVFDEATEFSESQVRFVSAWNRSTDPSVTCQTLLTFNPPMDESQDWIVRYFAPWLDDAYPDPAQSGEVRYVAMIDGAEQFSRKPFEGVACKRRTFIRAALSDNPYLMAAGYAATIDALPEPLRSALKGNFAAARSADPWQVIPRSWVDAARARWTPEPPSPLSSLGVDVARGGNDETAITPRHGTWHGEIETWPGRATPDGPSVAALVMQRNPGSAVVCVDVIGVGGSVYDHLVDICEAIAVNVSERSADTDRSGMLRFADLRSAMWWQLRESLDPEHGDALAMPPDDVLRAELCAPRFTVKAGGIIQVESKDELRKRLGRSTNRADALLLSRHGAGGWGIA